MERLGLGFNEPNITGSIPSKSHWWCWKSIQS